MRQAKFIYDTPNHNADLYYAAKFMAGDPFIYFEVGGKKYLVLSDLEIDRAKKQADADYYLSLPKYVRLAEKKNKKMNMADVLHEIFKEKKIRKLMVPGNTAFDLVDALRKRGYRIQAGPRPFYPKRFQKTKEEKKYIEAAQRAIFQAIRMTQDVLAKSKIKGNRLIYRGSVLTSERLRQMISVFLLEKGYLAAETIVACGPQSIDPHDRGSGPLKPHQSIIIDVFPKSEKTLYYGDATRTFCKGRAPDALKKLYAAVRKGQELALSKIRAGINAKKVHEAVHKYFESKGYKTGEKSGRRQGFFHSTGHGIGLELHEEPARIGPKDFMLKPGYVMSVEPGLYYSGIGGVRIEDLVYIKKGGCEVLASYPKHLEIR